jgi:hypothetical protein
MRLTLDPRINRFGGDPTIDKISQEVTKPVRREFISGRHHIVDRPPPVFAHEGSLEIIPTTDIDLGLFDSNEIEALPLTHWFAGGGHREYVISHPDQATDLRG